MVIRQRPPEISACRGDAPGTEEPRSIQLVEHDREGGAGDSTFAGELIYVGHPGVVTRGGVGGEAEGGKPAERSGVRTDATGHAQRPVGGTESAGSRRSLLGQADVKQLSNNAPPLAW